MPDYEIGITMTSNDDRTPEVPPTSDFPPPPPPVAPPALPVPSATSMSAPAGTAVPVYPNGKPMLDASGQTASPKSRLAAALLAWFLGVIGVHRFYVGKVGTGILMILTLGGLGVWILIDFILILVGSFKDKQGRVLSNW